MNNDLRLCIAVGDSKIVLERVNQPNLFPPVTILHQGHGLPLTIVDWNTLTTYELRRDSNGELVLVKP